jgi:hypothetical protein
MSYAHRQRRRRTGSVLVFGPGEYHSGEVWEGREWIYRAIYLDMEGLGALGAVFSPDSRPTDRF